MICLDEAAAEASGYQAALTVSRHRGGIFVWSGALSEWIIVARDIDTKRRLIKRYRRGVPIYAIEELTRVTPETLAAVNEMVRDMGAELHEV